MIKKNSPCYDRVIKNITTTNISKEYNRGLKLIFIQVNLRQDYSSKN